MRCVRLLSCLLLASMAACWRASPAPRSFEISRTSPDLGSAAAPLLLNDTITVYFSEPVQPVSVTADSVTVVDDEGQKVPGSLRVGSNWVSFVPEPPFAADLADGSFRPGANYRLMIAGSPRPDAVCSADGRRLSAARTYELRIADRGEVPPGDVSLLRPLATDVPFLLRPPEVPEMLPADAPRLRLHFTLPVLPTSVSADAFTLRLLPGFEVLRPRGVRIVSSRLDEWPGSTVEIDLGSLPRLHSTGETVSLGPGDWVSVELTAGRTALLDYSGNPPLPASPQCWSVVEGRSLALAEWPSGETSFTGDDPVMPGFEARSGSIRPRVRVEAGDGSLGVFHPQRDTTLRPGVPFDRGDGQIVASRGALFPFLAVDIPEGVTVAIDASGGPVHIVVCGGIRIDGTIEIAGESAPMVRRFETPAAELVDSAQVAMLAAGDVLVRGTVRTRVPPPADGSPLTLASAGRMHLHGELPFHTILGIEAPGAEQGEQSIVGARGQTIVVPASFRYGLAAGADFWVRGFTSWRRLPIDRDGGVLVLRDADPQLQIAWRAAPADSVRTDSPDLRLGKLGRPQAVNDRDVITAGPGAFVRFELSARLSDGAPLPQIRELRLEDR